MRRDRTTEGAHQSAILEVHSLVEIGLTQHSFELRNLILALLCVLLHLLLLPLEQDPQPRHLILSIQQVHLLLVELLLMRHKQVFLFVELMLQLLLSSFLCLVAL
jgi:hypothetical protein